MKSSKPRDPAGREIQLTIVHRTTANAKPLPPKRGKLNWQGKSKSLVKPPERQTVFKHEAAKGSYIGPPNKHVAFVWLDPDEALPGDIPNDLSSSTT
jgi:hypothetical protein